MFDVPKEERGKNDGEEAFVDQVGLEVLDYIFVGGPLLKSMLKSYICLSCLNSHECRH